MKHLLLLVVLLLAAFSSPGCRSQAPARKPPQTAKIPVLIVDGMNNHDWERGTRLLKAILEQSGLFTVDVSTTPSARPPSAAWDQWRPAFAHYQVVVNNFNGGHMTNGVRWPRAVEESFEHYVAGGGGVVIMHAANNAFLNWLAYNEMIGLGWRSKDFGPSLIVGDDGRIIQIPRGEGRNPGHGPEHDFQITVSDPAHPITRGMPRKWMHPQEQLTHGQHGPATNLHLLTYAWSKDANENEPMDWVTSYGRGRVYTTMLGHLWKDGPDTTLRCVGFQTLFIRGVEWAATRRVTYPMPQNFPTESQISTNGIPFTATGAPSGREN